MGHDNGHDRRGLPRAKTRTAARRGRRVAADDCVSALRAGVVIFTQIKSI